MTSWIVCQLGAREHYAIPRALYRAEQLQCLITDAWVSPHSWVHRLPGKVMRSLCDRNHPDLATAPIQAFTSSLIQFELRQRLQKTADWPRMIARNHWFQKQAIQYLRKVEAQLKTDEPPILFSYSYAALALFRYAKERGWRTVLGQMDPGILEEQIVLEEYRQHPELLPNWQSIPTDYWQDWQQECALADRIIVNSHWSKQLLSETGVDSKKIQIVPLVYEPPIAAKNFVRTFPQLFSRQRPLKVLFLGLVTLRKGIAALLEAIQLLKNEPVEFWMVGAQQIEIPTNLQNHSQIRWVGAVPRSQVQLYYQEADVFIFPTLSDGFGLTQLEAQSWQLPIITSRNCGDVIQDGVNGLVLFEVSGGAIATALRHCLADPEKLSTYAAQSVSASTFTLAHLESALVQR